MKKHKRTLKLVVAGMALVAMLLIGIQAYRHKNCAITIESKYGLGLRISADGISAPDLKVKVNHYHL